MDGIRTDQAAVNDLDLIRRLDITIPFSPTTSEVRYDLRLPKVSYKGLLITGIPRGNEPGRYWFQLRGSLIKVANCGQHNNDGKDPFEILYAMDDLVTQLRIDPFKTPLNGMELSVTIPVVDPEQVCKNIVSYLNRPPSYDTMERDGLQLPYTYVKAGNHKLKVYSPAPGRLRVEVNITKMQYLSKTQVFTFADLVEPRYALMLAKKLLAAFGKIIWKCPKLKQNDLTAEEWSLYQNGRVYEYWQVSKGDYDSTTEFKRIEKQRERERKNYDDIVQHHWPYEPPASIAQRMRQQLYDDMAKMNTPLYRASHDICLKRWQYVGNIPTCLRLPKHLILPQLSEIYPLYLCKSPTSGFALSNHVKLEQISIWDSIENFHQQQSKKSCTLSNQKSTVKQVDGKGQNYLQTQVKNSMTADLSRLKKAIRIPGGLLWSLAEVRLMLSANVQIALAHKGQNLAGLAELDTHRHPTQKSTPLFGI